MENNNFKDFTNLYELSKTLRFELRPTDEKSKKAIEIKNFETDFLIKNNRKKLFFYIDELLLEYIQIIFNENNLSNLNLNYYSQEYIQNKNNKEKKKNNKYTEENKLIELLIEKFSKVTIKGIKEEISYEEILKEKVLEFINTLYILDEEKVNFKKEEDKEEIKNIIRLFKWNFTKIKDFIENRKETIFCQKEKLKKWSILHRIIKENLPIFIDNKLKFEKIIDLFDNWNLDFIDQKYHFLESEKEVFELNYYKKCFLQSWIDKYNEKIWNLRSKLNNISQEIKNKNKEIKEINKNKESKIPLIPEIKVNDLKILNKQILWRVYKENIEFEIKSNKELFEKLKDLSNYNKNLNIKNIENHLFYYFDKFDNYENLSNIFIVKRAIETISWKVFKDFSFLKNILLLKQPKKLSDFYSLYDIKKWLEKFWETSELLNTDIFKEKYFDENILEKGPLENIFSNFIVAFKNEVKPVFDKYYEEDLRFNKMIENLKIDEIQNQSNIEKIQDYSQACLNIYRIIWYFLYYEIKDSEIIFKNIDKEDSDFYKSLHDFYDNTPILRYFNQFRNYLTKKPYSIDKVNVTFWNSQFLDWWQESKWKWLQYKWAILREKDKYFLCILKTPKILSNDKIFNNLLKEWEYYEFMEYKQLSWEKNIINKFTKDFWDYNPKRDNLNIERIKEIKKVLEDFEYNFPWLRNIIDDNNIKSIDELKARVKDSWIYQINFNRKISKDYIHNNEWLLLFEIYSKDFSIFKEQWSKVNQQTNYFLGLFDKYNLKNIEENNSDSIFKFDWQAKIFFRQKTDYLPQRENKTFIDKRDNNKEKNVIQNRRYSEDKLLIHLKMILNFKNNFWNIDDFNKKFNEEMIKLWKIEKIISLDRWEKHLIYLNLIDLDWKIILSKTLNLAWKDSNWNPVNYKKKLEEIESKRLEERKNWKYLTTIKNVKEWYLSQVVKEIADLAIENNAIIVMEDLTLEFKNNRKAIEREIYSKFEKALLKKLSYFVDKNWVFSNYRNWLQLVPNIEWKTEREINSQKQLWIIFYVNPWYTSQTCPNCNFVRSIYMKYNSLKEAEEEMKKYEIYFKNNEFIFNETDKKLIFYSWVPRLQKSRKNTEKKWETIEINITDEIKWLLEDNNIELDKEIWNQIILKRSKNLYEKLFNYINIILTLRNSETEREWLEKLKKDNNYIQKDFISCPVCKYNSENQNNISKSWKIREIEKLENADANWAYNIWRKWIIVLNKIKNDITNWELDLFINLEEWNKYLSEN